MAVSTEEVINVFTLSYIVIKIEMLSYIGCICACKHCTLDRFLVSSCQYVGIRITESYSAAKDAPFV